MHSGLFCGVTGRTMVHPQCMSDLCCATQPNSPRTQMCLQYFLHPGGRSGTVDSSKVITTLERLGKKGMKLTEHEGTFHW